MEYRTSDGARRTLQPADTVNMDCICRELPLAELLAGDLEAGF